jgi:hypothetical protein
MKDLLALCCCAGIGLLAKPVQAGVVIGVGAPVVVPPAYVAPVYVPPPRVYYPPPAVVYPGPVPAVVGPGYVYYRGWRGPRAYYRGPWRRWY